jgi:membrane protease subunit (stomatin/prohibitin family)
MGILDKLSGELIDIIEWTDNTSDTIVYRFERYGNEIKNGAQLTVRESQVAVFINEGRLADIFEPGMYELKTSNLPILSTLMGWAHGFNSPFKAEVYFINTKRFTDFKWGTPNPIMVRDPEFGPMRIRARGTFNFKISDPAQFIREVVGTDGEFTTDEIHAQLRNLIVTQVTDAIGESKMSAVDMAGNVNELGEIVVKNSTDDFAEYGIELKKVLVQNITLPEAVNEALDKRSSMGIIGNMNQYTQYQAANAMEDAAQNNGMAGGGMGMGMGFAMANQMGNAFAGSQQQGQTPPQQGQAAPPPLPGFFVAVNGQQSGPFDMAALQGMIQQGQFNKESLVWKNGMANWVKAGEVPELQSLFGAAPPPIPPA